MLISSVKNSLKDFFDLLFELFSDVLFNSFICIFSLLISDDIIILFFNKELFEAISSLFES